MTTAGPSKVTGPHIAVHVSLLNADHSVVGVGMPVIAYFTKPISDASAFARATTLTVNGKPATGAWYFERSANPGHPVEAHFRMQNYWPAESKIHISLPVSGLPAGGDFAYDDSLTLDFSTGPAQIVTVDDASHNLVLSRDGRTIEKAPVSLGAQTSPTKRGVKVIMEKGKDISMKGPGYYDAHVAWTQRLTYGGEYLHAAPWNSYNIQHGIDTSNGCTNLMDSDAKRLYAALRVGDVVDYPNASGPRMSLGDGYGDWNVSWPTWLTGGAVPTS
jgi:lipoprotein-anchoring transpeptidase ErfK/SrfK